jgi:hypothetical protein
MSAICANRTINEIARLVCFGSIPDGLAAKHGPEISLRDLTDRFSCDCLWRSEARSKKGKSACGVYLPDLNSRARTTPRQGW